MTLIKSSNKFDASTSSSQVNLSIETFNKAENERIRPGENYIDGIRNFVNNLNIYYDEIYKIEESLKDSEERKWSIKDYFSLPLRLYYSIILLVTLLKVRETNGSLTKEEAKWLKEFDREYQPKELPVADSLAPVLWSFKSYKITNGPEEPVNTEINSQGLRNLRKVGIDEIEFVFSNCSRLIMIPIVIFGTQLKSLLDPQDNSDSDNETVKASQDNGEAKSSQRTQFLKPREVKPIDTGEPLIMKWISSEFPESDQELRNAIHYWSKGSTRNIPSSLINLYQRKLSLYQLEIVRTSCPWFVPCCYAAKKQARLIPNSTTLDLITKH